jgi:hypothetical protein
MKYILPILLILAGCSADNSSNEINSYTEPQTDDYGLTLEPSDEMYISFETVSQLYQDTMACMGMTATAPTVAWKSFNEQYVGGAWGIYIATGELVWINTDSTVAQRNAVSDTETLKHEYVHHILHVNGMGETSHAHASPLFEKCGLGVYVKDGVPTAK